MDDKLKQLMSEELKNSLTPTTTSTLAIKVSLPVPQI
jgi:hypothetical protein